ncbi:MAG: flagellar hook-length control protein FliK [Burkholderiaceae bacterium]
MGAPADLPSGVLQPHSGAAAAGSRAERTQANAPTSLPDDAPSPWSETPDDSCARTETGSERAVDRSASASSTRAAPTSNTSRREAGSVDADRDADAHEDFASVLAASSPADAISTVPTPLPTAAATDQADEAAPPPTELPAQFLALLSGNWELHAGANGAATNAESRAAAAASPASLSAAIPRANATAAPASLLTATVTATQPNGAAANTEPGAAAAALPAPSPVAIPLAAGPPLATTVAAASADAKAPAIPATLAASGIAYAGRDTVKPGGDAAAPVDAVSADSFSLAATTPAPAPLRATLSALTPPVPLALPTDPDAGFDDGFGTRIAWMAEQRLGHAQIRLNPEHVGPIEVRVQLDGDRVSAQFSSAHAEVRQAIEASLPRLRDMLGQHGLQLGQADVGQGGTGRGGDRGNSQGGDRPNGSKEGLQPLPASFRGNRRLLDEYA